MTTRNSRGSVAKAPTRRVALILGAGIGLDRQPSPVLRTRIETGVALLSGHKVDVLIMSGDNSRKNYDEVTVMKDTAVSLGADPQKVLLDYAGFRTLDSCARLRKVFGQTSALVVSQQFHLPRAIHLCRAEGIDAYGVVAPDPRGRTFRWKSTIREIPATTQAWLDAHVLHTKPKFLGDPIDIDNPPTEALKQPLD